ncbi:uncharacterized protein LOC136063531 [Quercus suber]|uniref:uncharacterized protein LOC136063531 n=1 Tax=Quercus suber TaxID=58331 RepID=UPI0032DF896F
MGQINETYEAKEERMKKYLEKVLRLVKKFKKANFVQIPREEKVEADILAKKASAIGAMDEFDGVQYVPSIDLPKVQQIENEENWITPIISYLKDRKLPKGKDEARRLRIRAARYVLIDEVLYKGGFSQPYLRCLTPDEANYVLREVHEGACGNHSRVRSLIHKVVGAGYYWPTIQVDAKTYVKVCDQCQRFGNVPRQPLEDFYEHFGIQNHYSSPAHPQANGQTEVVNRFLLKIIKTRLEGAKGVWPDKLPGVLWVYRTTVRTPTGETPFKLAYGIETVIPAEVHMANNRMTMYQDKNNEEQLRVNLDLIDEVRTDAEQRMAGYKNLMAR